MQKELELPRSLVNELLHHAQSTPELEVCGLISQKNNGDFISYPINNIAESPAKEFLMEPEQQVNIMKKMKAEDEHFFGIYHSHPTAPALPSATDLEQAYYPDPYYFIISLNTKGVLEIRCFKLLHDENVAEISLSMSES